MIPPPSVAMCLRRSDIQYSMLSHQPIVSACLKPVVIVSSSVCQSHSKQKVESYHEITLSSPYRHRILGSVGCKGHPMITCSGNHKPEKNKYLSVQETILQHDTSVTTHGYYWQLIRSWRSMLKYDI